MERLPRAKGTLAVLLQVVGRGAVWDVTLRQVAPTGAAATEVDARAVADALVGLAQEAKLRVGAEPTVVLGGCLMDGGGAERIEAWEGAELLLRRHGLDVQVEAAGALEAARALSERSVLELGEGLEALSKLAAQQCVEVGQVVKNFDTSGGLDAALTALEGELSSVGQKVHGALTSHLGEVGGAAVSAHDIVRLASAVEQIAHSARVLTFNAKIESARLGSQGKGFVVIAGAISELAKDVSTSNELVSNLADELARRLPTLERATAELAAATEAQLEALRQRVGSLRESFVAARARSVAELERAEAVADAVRTKSDEAIRHLQFQDRTSQLLMQVKEQVQVLEAALGVDEVPVDDHLARVGKLGREREDKTIALAPGEVALF